MVRYKVFCGRPDVEGVEVGVFVLQSVGFLAREGKGKGPLQKMYSQISSVIWSGVIPKGPGLVPSMLFSVGVNQW